ncbi:hypothetical protein BHE90_017590 [Fusarium euwallaceae]|uniref:Uncharacterized protein n=1 Tax=Fusarium euwallaceae TaxID=1147111 RepID=A0A430KXG5_9HYPO|nr:hypothetical protein BHE90_017590 [Fusarium euwallaceae]
MPRNANLKAAREVVQSRARYARGLHRRASIATIQPLSLRAANARHPESSVASFQRLVTAARTASRLGAHLGPSDADFPPRKKEKFPNILYPAGHMTSRSVSYLEHRKRKCSVVSGAHPHSHTSDSAAPILLR